MNGPQCPQCSSRRAGQAVDIKPFAGFSISISKFLNSKFIYCEAAHTRYYAYEQSSLAHLYSSFFNSDLKLEIGNVFDNKRVVVHWYESWDWLGKIGCVGWAWVRASVWQKAVIVYFQWMGYKWDEQQKDMCRSGR